MSTLLLLTLCKVRGGVKKCGCDSISVQVSIICAHIFPTMKSLLQVALSFLFMFSYGNSEHETETVRRPASMRVIITSGIGSADRRHACRATWLKWIKHAKHEISYVFHVEAPVNDVERSQIRQEEAVFKDIALNNGTAPRGKSLASCSIRRWEALNQEFQTFKDRVDYYLIADDDSFVCIHHLLSDSKYWPVGKRVHISHYVFTFPDVVSIYSSLLLNDALQVLSEKDAYRSSPLHAMVMAKDIKDVDNINDVRLAFGAGGSGQSRYNDYVHGWVGVDLLNATEKATICNKILTLHQVFPNLMVDLWNYMMAKPAPEVFTVPVLSRNIVDLENTEG